MKANYCVLCILLLTFSMNSLCQQTTDYDGLWATVKSNVDKNFSKTALQTIKQIETAATAENNTIQQIKADIYKVSICASFEEDFFENAITEFENKTAESKLPEKNIYYSLTAELYNMYFNNVASKNGIVNSAEKSEDIKTWSREDFMNKSYEYYLLSLKDEAELQKYPIENYDDILICDTASRTVRPTLFEFLSFRAIDFFSDTDNNLIGYSISNEKALSPFYDFIKIDIDSTFSESPALIDALIIYQKIIKYNAKNIAVCIDADLSRLDFVKNNNDIPDYEDLYLNSLLRLERTFSLHPSTADIMYKIASFYYNTLANKDKNIYDYYKDAYVNAANYCEKTFTKYPDANGGRLCRNLYKKIVAQNIYKVYTATAYYPNEKFPIQIEYKNCEKLFFKIVQLDFNKDLIEESNNRLDKESLEYLLSKIVVREWYVDIDDGDDYRSHTVDAIIDNLDEGLYGLLVSTGEDFDLNNEFICSTVLQISKLNAIIAQNQVSDNYEFIICDRNSGKLITNCKINIYTTVYGKNPKLELLNSFTSDKNGKAVISKQDIKSNDNYYRDIIFTLNKDDDTFFSEQYFNFYKRDFSPSTSTLIYTDRGIYRPGQTIYFKGIVNKTEANDKHQPVINHKGTITLRDANYQNIAKQDFTTNEFGSFAGSFIIPNNALTGNYTLSSSEYGSLSVKVEEYKRPTFEISFEKETEQNKCNSEVGIKVKALTYTGLPLENATVKYKIHRTTAYRFSYWSFYDFANDDIFIEVGQTKTDGKGNASINFTAKCPKAKNFYFKPIYRFQISADITDISGETITQTFDVNVSEIAMIIKSDIPEYVNLNEANSFRISAYNIDNEEVNAKLNIKICTLKKPENLKRNRLWNSEPDIFMFSKDEFNKLLPKDIYSNENDISSWEIKETLRSFTSSDGVIDLSKSGIKASEYYVVEVTANDAFGNEIKEKFFFTAGTLSEAPAFKEKGIALLVPKDTYHPGENLEFSLFSSEKKTTVSIYVTNADKILLDETLTISGYKTFSIPIGESERGSLTIAAKAIFDNRQFNDYKTVNIPFDNKDLKIELLTQKDYITPGGNETWSLIITNKNDSKNAVEVLASMYDMSLDQFYNIDYNRVLFYKQGCMKKFVDVDASNVSYGTTLLRTIYENVNGYSYDKINWLDLENYHFYRYKRAPLLYCDGVGSTALSIVENDVVENEATMLVEDSGEITNDKVEESKDEAVQSIRRDFRETAFFYPQLTVNTSDTLKIEFQVPESMTKWKFRAVAYNKDLDFGLYEQEIVAKKDFYIQANVPKLLYEKDVINFAAKVANLTENSISGTSFIEIYDINGNNITTEIVDKPTTTFNVKGMSSDYVKWNIAVPENISLLKIRVGANANNKTDIEEHLLPVLTTKVLITESLPLTINKKGISTYKFKAFDQKYSNADNITQSITLEYTPNPIWYAVQALPYIEDNSEISEVVFNNLYANLIAAYIVNKNPQIEEIYKKIQATNPDEFLSELDKNQELKDILLKETPWVIDARNEQEQRERLAILFDFNQMSYNKKAAISTLKSIQMSSGAFPWIKNGSWANLFTTTNIIAGFVHLEELGIIDLNNEKEIKNIISSAISYLDTKNVEWYNKLKEKDLLKDYTLCSDDIKYLYLRTKLGDKFSKNNNTKEVYNFYLEKAEKTWTKHSLYSQSMIALTLNELDKDKIAKTIVKSFDERALHSEELGMYWRDLENMSLFNYSSKIETMSLMIQCYHDINADSESIAEMKRWLLNLKRSTMWETGKATVDAIYALFIGSSPSIVGNYQDDIVTIGSQTVGMEDAIPGSGYIKRVWDKTEVNASFCDISIDKKAEGTAWSNVYWQYTTDYENVTSAGSGLSVERQILKSDYKDNNFEKVTNGEEISSTDKIVVRMIIKADRDMEYVHLKDIIPACFIPEDVLSGFRYSNGLSYYLSIRDESMNYFFERLDKGSYIIEYKVNIQQSGDFTGGISKIQCLYAPEFGGQSAGIRVKIEN